MEPESQAANAGPGNSSQPSTAPHLDNIDREIIRILQRNGRTSNTEIGRSLGLTETTIRKRIARLLAEELVNIVAVPTPRAVGLTISAILGISCELSALERVAERLVARPEVRYLGISTGRYDIMIEAFFSDQRHLLEFSSKTLGSIDGITDVETSLILDVAKFSYEWEIP